MVAAHPDDEVLGCGATISRLVKEGGSAFCLLLNKGRSKQTSQNNKANSLAQKEAIQASKVLGISKVLLLDLPDQKYDTVPFLDIVQQIEKIKQEAKPDIVFTHHPSDLNLDHKVTSRAVLTAFRPLKGERVKKIYGFDVQEASRWLESGFVPNVFFDVSAVFNKKILALKAYKSELKQYPHPRSSESIETIAKYWGIVSGQTMSEAFVLLRHLV